ncbi:hypothetical protein V8C86DRAFT_2625280 [Haematococcus lacustris]
MPALMVPSARLDPSSLPPAGRALVHDSSNEDYRFISSLSSPDHHSSPRRHKAEWTQSSPSYHKPDPVRPVPASDSLPRQWPDKFSVADIPCAAPSCFPGLTLILPPLPTRPSSSSSPVQPAAAAGAKHPPLDAPHPPRNTNPLQPCYHWPAPPPPGEAIAAAPQPPSLLPSSQQRCHSSLDVSDLPGARPRATTRCRKEQHDAFLYADVDTRHVHPLRQRLLREGRPAREAPDTRPLGLWGTCGDSGHMLASRRAPTNPLAPAYQIHGRLISDEPCTSRRALGGTGRPAVP